MSVKQISILRKNGQLHEAYQIASEELKLEPSDPWIQMAMFWVLRDLCTKEYMPSNATEKINKAITIMAHLLPTMKDDDGIGTRVYQSLTSHLAPESKDIVKASQLSKDNPDEAYLLIKKFLHIASQLPQSLHEDLGWIIYRYLKHSSSRLSSVDVRKLLRDYILLNNERPSMLHFSILNFAILFSKDHSDFSFYRFFMLWNPTNLRKQDYQKSMFNGKEIPSFVARICKIIVETGEKFDVDDFCMHIRYKKSITIELLRESYFWKLFHINNEGNTHAMYHEFANYVQQYAHLGSSKWHSEILKLAERCMTGRDENKFIYFFQQWNYTNFQSSDWEESTDEKGNNYRPLVLKVAKKCFDVLKTMPMRDGSILQWLSEFYDHILEIIDYDEWAYRQRAILCLWMNDAEDALSRYKMLVRKLNNKYYIWSEMAQCVSDTSLKMSLLCKALSLERNENFIGEIRLSLAELFIAKGMNAEACNELKLYKTFRDQAQKPPSAHYLNLVNHIDDISIIPSNIKSSYNAYIQKAEEFAFSDVDSHECVLVGKSKDEGKIKYTLCDKTGFSFTVNGKQFKEIEKASLGTVFLVKYIEDNINCHNDFNRKRIMVLCLKKTEVPKWNILALKYGYVDFVNSEKKCIHILSEQSHYIIDRSSNIGSFRKGQFVSFREYNMNIQNGVIYKAANTSIVDKALAIPHYPNSLVVVDGVNLEKKLFHYIASDNKISGVVLFADTHLRPSEGNFLEIVYAMKKDKSGKSFLKVLYAQYTDKTDSRLFTTVHGVLRIKQSHKNNSWHRFGFINDYYVSASMLEKYKIDAPCHVSADVVYTGDNKWKVIKIYDIEDLEDEE